jgi:DNA-binding response OmpR family regulator
MENLMSEENRLVLLVSADDVLRAFLADNLFADGYTMLAADSGERGRRLAEEHRPDAVIVDLALPERGGCLLIRAIRTADGIADRLDPTLSVVALGNRRDDELECLRGFEHGADDYLARPFGYPELRARLTALLRRARMRAAGGRMRVGALTVDVPSRTTTLHGERVELSAKEFALLRTLVAEPTRVFTKDELMRGIWGHGAVGSTRTLDGHACRLRHKLRARGDALVVNVWGVGYRLVDGVLHPTQQDATA